MMDEYASSKISRFYLVLCRLSGRSLGVWDEYSFGTNAEDMFLSITTMKLCVAFSNNVNLLHIGNSSLAPDLKANY